MVLNISDKLLEDYRKQNCTKINSIDLDNSNVINYYIAATAYSVSLFLAIMVYAVKSNTRYIFLLGSMIFLLLAVYKTYVYITYKKNLENTRLLCENMMKDNPDLVYASQFLDLS